MFSAFLVLVQCVSSAGASHRRAVENRKHTLAKQPHVYAYAICVCICICYICVLSVYVHVGWLICGRQYSDTLYFEVCFKCVASACSSAFPVLVHCACVLVQGVLFPPVHLEDLHRYPAMHATRTARYSVALGIFLRALSTCAFTGPLQVPSYASDAHCELQCSLGPIYVIHYCLNRHVTVEDSLRAVSNANAKYTNFNSWT